MEDSNKTNKLIEELKVLAETNSIPIITADAKLEELFFRNNVEENRYKPLIECGTSHIFQFESAPQVVLKKIQPSNIDKLTMV